MWSHFPVLANQDKRPQSDSHSLQDPKLQRLYRRARLDSKKCISRENQLASPAQASQTIQAPSNNLEKPRRLEGMSSPDVTPGLPKHTSTSNEASSVEEQCSAPNTVRESVDQFPTRVSGGSSRPASRGNIRAELLKTHSAKTSVHEKSSRILWSQVEQLFSRPPAQDIPMPTPCMSHGEMSYERSGTADSVIPVTCHDRIAERNRKGRERSMRTRTRNVARMKLLEERTCLLRKENAQLMTIIQESLEKAPPTTARQVSNTISAYVEQLKKDPNKSKGGIVCSEKLLNLLCSTCMDIKEHSSATNEDDTHSKNNTFKESFK